MIGLVLMMGVLYDGYMVFVVVVKVKNDVVIVIIFVNLIQFGEVVDLEVYFRIEVVDCVLLNVVDVDVVFIFEVGEMYFDGDEIIVEIICLVNMLYGVVWLGYYCGVIIVVCKLFNFVQVDNVYFGEKDYQQLQVICWMVCDLFILICINGVLIVCEVDGLVMLLCNVCLLLEDCIVVVVLF